MVKKFIRIVDLSMVKLTKCKKYETNRVSYLFKQYGYK